ncbi:hypothetical protein QJS10_CPB15g01620 [Acorus calamus]|uniref:Uncharacterized protein n=1 Tax=Acorus calamus TaxID=4465 RepID=A0AAV9D4I0_ACOCL|nr:hypothetical protein QJS10_CPB15g01620 [Acorus calamus]
MGCPFGLEEEEGGVVEEIVKVCSFNSLSCLEVNRSGTTEVAGFDIENLDVLEAGRGRGLEELSFCGDGRAD